MICLKWSGWKSLILQNWKCGKSPLTAEPGAVFISVELTAMSVLNPTAQIKLCTAFMDQNVNDIQGLS